MRNFVSRKTRLNTAKLKQARKNLKTAVNEAKNKWTTRHCKTINNKYGTKEAWNATNDLKRGLSKTKPYANKQMKWPDGSICLRPEENSEVFCKHFRTLYGRQAHYDESVLPQQPVYDECCDYLPTDQEIRDATHKLKNKAPGESGIMAPV